jgi:hypothetical protein
MNTKMLRIEKNLILVDCVFGSFFIDNAGRQVQDPDRKTCEADLTHGVWARYTFLRKKPIDSPSLRSKIKIIIDRMRTAYQV